MFDRITQPLITYINENTPYQNLLERSSFYSRPLIRQITMLVCAMLTMCHLVNRFSWQSRNVVDLTRSNQEELVPLREIKEVHLLDTKVIKDVDHYDFKETVPAFMDKYTCVCPYKPCGYTEFGWGEIAKGPSEKDAKLGIKYQGAVITNREERQRIQKQRNEQIQPIAQKYFEDHEFDNLKRKTTTEHGYVEFRAAHPQTIFEICNLNKKKIAASSWFSGISQDQSGETKKLKQALIKALECKDVNEVARIFLLLSEIPDSLPASIFQATFGDVDGPDIQEITLPDSLRQMKQLYQEFKTSPSYQGHSEQTIRNIVSYYYHEGSEDPIGQARTTLNALAKNVEHYVVVSGKIMKADHLYIR